MSKKSDKKDANECSKPSSDRRYRQIEPAGAEGLEPIKLFFEGGKVRTFPEFMDAIGDELFN